MGMGAALVNLELAVNIAAEAVVRNHSLDGFLKQELWVLLANSLRIGLLLAANESGVAAVDLVRLLLAAENDMLRIDDDDIISGIHVGGEDGLVLAT